MPVYNISDPETGRSMKIRGSSPPTERELIQLFGSSTKGADKATPKEMKPLFQQLDPEQHKILASAQEVLTQLPGAFWNEFFAGLPEAGLKKAGISFPKPATTAGKVARVAGGIGGLATGVVGKAFQAPFKARALAKSSLAVKSGLGSALAGGLSTPESETGDILQPAERAKQAAISGITGAAIGKTISVGKAIAKVIPNLINKPNFARKVRSSGFFQVRKAGVEVDNAIQAAGAKDPSRVVDLSDEITSMSSAMSNIKENPGLAGDIKSVIRGIKDPLQSNNINAMLKNPKLAKNLSSPQVQAIKRAIQASPRIANKLKQGKFANWTQGETELLDMLNNVREKQMQAFPELSKSFKNYHKVKTDFDIIKNTLKKGNLLKNVGQQKGAKWDDPEIKEVVNNFFPEDLVKEMGGYKNATQFLKTAGIIGGSVAGAGTVGYLLRRKAYSNFEGGQQ